MALLTSKQMMECERHILTLPPEIILMVAQYLEGNNIVSFAETCSRFSSITRSIKIFEFANTWNIPLRNFESFLSSSVDPKRLLNINFSNCYWVSQTTLSRLLKKCINLQVLNVQGTKLTAIQIAQILVRCIKLAELSITLQPIEHTKNENFVFNQCQETLKKLMKLEILSCTSTSDTFRLVSLCDNLEELVLVFAAERKQDEFTVDHHNLITHHVAGSKKKQPLVPSFRGKFVLKSLVLLDLERYNDTFGSRPVKFSYDIDFSRINVYWNESAPCPASVPRQINGLSFKSINFEETPAQFHLLWGEDESEMKHWMVERNPLHILDFRNLESVKEPIPTIMKEGLHLSTVKFIDCFYYEEMFLDFCANHPEIRALRLRAPLPSDRTRNNQNPQLIIHSKTPYQLPKLKALSMEPSLLTGTNNPMDKIPPLKRFLQANLQTLEEIEISSFNNNSDAGYQIFDLSLIMHCKSLRKLTLGNLLVRSGNFLEEIIKGCVNLESLRLNSLGASGLCCYSKSLCNALPYACKLKTFCLRQKNVVPLGILLDALEKLPCLVQLGLTVPSSADPLKLPYEKFLNRFSRLISSCNQLVAFFCVLNVAKSHCAKTTKQLNLLFTSSRPAFCTEMQSSSSLLNIQSNYLPSVHQEALVYFTSHIGNRPLK